MKTYARRRTDTCDNLLKVSGERLSLLSLLVNVWSTVKCALSVKCASNVLNVYIKLGITEVPQWLSAPTCSTVGDPFLTVRLVTKSGFGQD